MLLRLLVSLGIILPLLAAMQHAGAHVLLVLQESAHREETPQCHALSPVLTLCRIDSQSYFIPGTGNALSMQE